ncbi:uncharacterized protein LOC111324122 [Stylophora pistillata]|uniref:Uncharacterized protein n=1 Tax=Stylophora pistillata TaxID=50429 RepID=A0A2B4SN94_STYPI|nr:uncharacterized protein LOC111324122 [Stylophora pistillata]PFX29992.1 hypothetical protein AWC38_SpisGene5226 [Stylophora pistillata]
MYSHIPPNALTSPQMGNEQFVFLATSPGLASSYGPANPMPSTAMPFPGQGAPQLTGISSSAAYGCGPVIGVQVPMWTHVPQTSPTVMGNVMQYPTQPLQYQACIMPPVQHTNHGMCFNNQPYNQMQPYNMLPHQYIPVPNRGFRQRFSMGQPPNVPHVMSHDCVPVANSGFSHPAGGMVHPQFLPPDPHAREAMYEMSIFQQAQYIPQYPTTTHQHPQISAVVQRRPGVVNQQAYLEVQKSLPNSEQQGGVCAVHLLHEEESAGMHRPVRSDGNSIAGLCEQAPAPPQQHILDNTDSIQSPHQHMLDCVESVQVPCQQIVDNSETIQSPRQHLLENAESAQSPRQHLLESTESIQSPHQDMLDSSESIQADATVSPSQMTLVPSPSSSDGVQTVCSSPVQSDSEEGELTVAEDDQIPTKDTSDDITLHDSPVEVNNADNFERLEPEQPYDSSCLKPEQCNLIVQTKPLMKEEKYGPQKREVCGSSSINQGVEGIPQNAFGHHLTQPCISRESKTSTTQMHNHYHRSIRSLIDTPVYDTAHSRVLSQLSHPDATSTPSHDGSPGRPLTTHFRQLFKPIPHNTSKSAIKEDGRS